MMPIELPAFLWWAMPYPMTRSSSRTETTRSFRLLIKTFLASSYSPEYLKCTSEDRGGSSLTGGLVTIVRPVLDAKELAASENCSGDQTEPDSSSSRSSLVGSQGSANSSASVRIRDEPGRVRIRSARRSSNGLNMSGAIYFPFGLIMNIWFLDKSPRPKVGGLAPR